MAASLPEHIESMKAEGHSTGPDESEQDFTEEELRLEAEVEQALSELEAVDAAAAALRLELENVVDDVEATRKELTQLKAVAANWERAAADGKRELAERELRVQELLKSLPP